MVYNDPHNFDDGDILTGTRLCKKCDIRKDMLEFHWTTGKTGRRRVCKQCCAGRAKELRQEDPDKYKTKEYLWHIKGTYNLSMGDYQRLIQQQDSRCAICKTQFDINDVNKRPHVDHDHACCPSEKSCGQCIRGLLCFACNTGIGKLKDDIEVLKNAIGYLEWNPFLQISLSKLMIVNPTAE